MNAWADSILYLTGRTPEGKILVGGLWKLWEQEGFPLETSYLLCQDRGWAPDWLEAMADASTTNNCPALVNHFESFLPAETMDALKAGFVRELRARKTYEQILSEKRNRNATKPRTLSTTT